jgi:hypothetical protein
MNSTQSLSPSRHPVPLIHVREHPFDDDRNHSSHRDRGTNPRPMPIPNTMDAKAPPPLPPPKYLAFETGGGTHKDVGWEHGQRQYRGIGFSHSSAFGGQSSLTDNPRRPELKGEPFEFKENRSSTFSSAPTSSIEEGNALDRKYKDDEGYHSLSLLSTCIMSQKSVAYFCLLDEMH